MDSNIAKLLSISQEFKFTENTKRADGREEGVIIERSYKSYVIQRDKDLIIDPEQLGKKRGAADFFVNTYVGVEPFGFKATNGRKSQSDNAITSAALAVSLAGFNLPIDGSVNKNSAIKLLEEFCNGQLPDIDYHFIVYFKNTKDVLYTPLRRIPKEAITSNADNFPQVDWKRVKASQVSSEVVDEAETANHVISMVLAGAKKMRDKSNKWIGALENIPKFNEERRETSDGQKRAAGPVLHTNEDSRHDGGAIIGEYFREKNFGA